MIDTVKLYTKEFKISESSKFQKQETKDLNTGQLQSEKIFCNSVSGINLSLKQDFDSPDHSLYLQTSLPKLLYGTSLYEVTESDCERAVTEIEKRLSSAGVFFPDNKLKDFQLSRVDFCKNLQIENSLTDYLLTLKNFQISRKQKSLYKGETLTFYNKSHELSFYNKIKEIRDTVKDTNILNLIADRKENLLRVESRLKHRKVIIKQFKKFDMRLTDLFDNELCKNNLLTHYDSLVKEKDLQLEFDFEHCKEILKELQKEKSRNIHKEFVALVGLEQFLNWFSYDWELVRKFFIECGVNRRQSFNIVKEYRKQYEKYLIKPKNRDLVKELREKIAC